MVEGSGESRDEDGRWDWVPEGGALEEQVYLAMGSDLMLS